MKPSRTSEGAHRWSRRGFVAAAASLTLAPGLAWAQVVGNGSAVGQAGAIVTRGGLGGMILSGRTRAHGGRALRLGDHWHIGSNTKAMTSALYARLVETGRARRGATLPSLFPDLAVDAAWSMVTVEQLMGHTAGVTDARVDPAWLMQRHRDRGDVRGQRTAFTRQLLAVPPTGQPGTYRYGNAGYVLLGAAIERATGLAWEDALAREVWVPLGIRSAGFGAPPADGPWGHAPGPVPVDPAGVADNPAVLGPAWRAHLALADYGRFLSIFLGGDGFLSPDTLAWLLSPPAGSTYAGGWSVAAGPVLVHEGSNILWHAIAELHPKRGLGFVGIANEGGPRGRAAALAILERARVAVPPN